MSLGTDTDYHSLHDACDAAYAACIIVVAAAGNDGNPPGKGDNVDYPGAYSSVIAVAVIDSNDKRATWSSTGPAVELSAPGVSIYSTWLDGGYATKSGTSMACPHVSGTAALVIASDSSLSNVDVRQRLQETADDLGATGFDTKYGYGLVDADEAAPQPSGVPLVINIVNPADESTVSGTEVTIEVNASDDIEVDKVEYSIDSGAYQVMTYNSSTGYWYWETTWDSTGVADGPHTITAKATDTIGQTSIDTITVNVDNTANFMHIASINMSTKTAGVNTNAIATVTIADANGSPVEGAAVSGHWSGLTSDSGAGATDAYGRVALESNKVKDASGTFTFTVDDMVLDGWEYDANANKKTSDSIAV
jgi:subtilisin